MGAKCTRHQESYYYKKASKKTKVLARFPQFELLNDDLVLNILSYVSTAPFELSDRDHHGTLTHVLPLTSHRFREICHTSNILWGESLRRLVTKEPQLWNAGLESLLKTLTDDIRKHNNQKTSGDISTTMTTTSTLPLPPSNSNNDDETSSSSSSDTTTESTKITTPPIISTTHKLLNQVISTFEQWKLTQHLPTHHHPTNPPPPIPTTRCIYRALLIEHRHFFYPVFHLPTPSLRLHRTIILHLFEPRYRRLIADVTSHLPPRYYRQGHSSQSIPSHRAPRFVYAHRDLRRGSRALVVEVRRCRIYRDGRADVVLVPVEVVELEVVRVRENSGGLVDARVVRKGRRTGSSVVVGG